MMVFEPHIHSMHHALATTSHEQPSASASVTMDAHIVKALMRNSDQKHGKLGKHAKQCQAAYNSQKHPQTGRQAKTQQETGKQF